jgi:inward rectifier potassium channel
VTSPRTVDRKQRLMEEILSPEGTPIMRLGLERLPFYDIYHYLLVAPWPIILLCILGAFSAANALFALGYVKIGGVVNAHPGSFKDAFFFSVQTMATIGYGTMVPHSTAANLLVALEALSGGVGLALMTGLVFAKFSRPTARVRFSKVALISQYRGRPCLMFRMANEREDRIVQPQLQAVLFRTVKDDETGGYFVGVHDLALVRDRHAFLSLTWLVIHPIDDRSPLRELTAESADHDHSMVVISLTGIDEGISQTVHAHFSYRLGDIRWGARFVDLIRPANNGGWVIDYAHFDDVVQA